MNLMKDNIPAFLASSAKASARIAEQDYNDGARLYKSI